MSIKENLEKYLQRRNSRLNYPKEYDFDFNSDLYFINDTDYEVIKKHIKNFAGPVWLADVFDNDLVKGVELIYDSELEKELDYSKEIKYN